MLHTRQKLAAFNGGAPLRGARVVLSTGVELVGLVKTLRDGRLRVYLADGVVPKTLACRECVRIEDIVPERVPELAYTMEVKHGLGGIGRHLRRRTYPDSETEAVRGMVVFRSDAGEVREVREVCAVAAVDDGLARLKRVGASLEYVHFDWADAGAIDVGMVPCVVLGTNVPHLVAALARDGFVVVFPGVRHATIMCDSLNRRQFTHQAQYLPPEDLGCVRSFWKERLGHIPQHAKRKTLFTWEAWAGYVCDEFQDTFDLTSDGGVTSIRDALASLELPLRAYAKAEMHARVERILRANEERGVLLQQQRSFAFCAYRGVSADAFHIRLAAHTMRLLLSTSDVCDVDRTRVEARLLERAGEADEACAAMHREEACRLTDELRVLATHTALMRSMRDADSQTHLETTQYILHPLSDEQATMAIDAFHSYYFYSGQQDAYQRRVCQATLLHLTLCTGHYVHWCAPYSTGSHHPHAGQGDRIRFPLQDARSLPTETRNRLYEDSSGALRGRGAKPYKGRFASQDGKPRGKPPPKRCLRRTSKHEMAMAAVPTGPVAIAPTAAPDNAAPDNVAPDNVAPDDASPTASSSDAGSVAVDGPVAPGFQLDLQEHVSLAKVFGWE